jgi:hypothetical protein
MRWGRVAAHGNRLTLRHSAIGDPIQTLGKCSSARGAVRGERHHDRDDRGTHARRTRPHDTR